MINIITKVLFGLVTSVVKSIVGMKFGWIFLVIVAIIALLFIIKLIHNITTGSFNVVKFASGFNLFNGQVQGKLIYYFIIFSIVSAIALGIYGKITQDTFENNYKNVIKNNEEVTVDQRQIVVSPDDNLLIGIKLFGLKVGITHTSKPKVREILNNKDISTKAEVNK
jgi:hypothetical protein